MVRMSSAMFSIWALYCVCNYSYNDASIQSGSVWMGLTTLRMDSHQVDPSEEGCLTITI